ncbi:S24/S26 family peptidase [Aliamphritea spongicola]|uniref:S24/S26 family peptidase n=1 Tax=Aliamphritea spongicola TaxID=707589 RepID=UPI00196AF4BD|nr:S24/S26 family peptidase [Aliamphritea spongicola]MBN3561392.1 S24/S26 family peptidase [Aliamphritea spongicola]
MISIHRVNGQSMLPAFADGDYVLCIKPLPFMPLKKGDVVVIQHPRLGCIIKRVANLSASHDMWLSGDSPHSTSSEVMGWQPRQTLIGRVAWHIARPSPVSG